MIIKLTKKQQYEIELLRNLAVKKFPEGYYIYGQPIGKELQLTVISKEDGAKMVRLWREAKTLGV